MKDFWGMRMLVRLPLDSSHMIFIRSVIRKIGVTRLLSRLFPADNNSYEQRFQEEMKQAIKMGDVVWDVGAYQGYYTENFYKWVGAKGKVIAFEPVPDSFRLLMSKVNLLHDNHSQIECYNIALGNTSGSIRFLVDREPSSPTCRVLTTGDSLVKGNIVELPIERGDELVGRLALSKPNVIKIDVEGYEYEVLQGLDEMLSRDSCRDIFVEIHFKLLEERGKPMNPNHIISFLRNKGFSVKWVDLSHLRASRNS